ncbi:MAG: hypothetical protein D6724_03040 [Armatimonadetes bacterium]|nr:MAG: hypothetical protein D6724_03040 [Armatimonadota bacterium]
MAEFGQTLLVVASAGVAAFVPSSPSSMANLSLLDSDTHTYLLAAWRAEQQGDYIQAARYARLVAPPEEITFRVVFDEPSEARSEQLSDILEEAIGQWSGSGVRFVETDQPNAVLQISFRERVRGRSGTVAGITRTHRSLTSEGVVTIRAEIEVSTRSPFGSALPEDAILKTLLHELGHFFGLKDSTDPLDIMGPVRLGRSNVVDLTEAQRQTVGFLSGEAWRLSTLAPTATVDPRERKPRVFTFPSL